MQLGPRLPVAAHGARDGTGRRVVAGAELCDHENVRAATQDPDTRPAGPAAPAPATTAAAAIARGRG